MLRVKLLKNLNDLIDITRGHIEFQRQYKAKLEGFKARLTQASNDLEIQRIINDMDEQEIDTSFLA